MFRKLGLSEHLLKVIEELKYDSPSEIQKKAIPIILSGRDVIGNAATGSGKTLAFAAGIIEKIKKGKGMQALVLTPTRELAEQVSRALRNFSKNHGLHVTEVYGGVGIEPQIDKIRYSEVVVGTPGRILDHIDRRTLDLSKVDILVLDEADRMVDMGFLPDVERIIRYCPAERQTLLFSATSTQDVERIAKKYMKDPIKVVVETQVDPTKLSQSYYDVESHLKFSLLVHLLREEKTGLVMVFCNTRKNVNHLSRNLKMQGLDAIAIHGGLTQNRRSNVLEMFHSAEVKILVCTDVAARGLDIPNVTHVYNYDSPKTVNDYIHRIGRTARAGKDGQAITLISERNYENFRRIHGDSSLNIVKMEVPKIERIAFNVREDKKDRGYGRFGASGRENLYGEFKNRFRRKSLFRYGNDKIEERGRGNRRYSRHSRNSSHTFGSRKSSFNRRY